VQVTPTNEPSERPVDAVFRATDIVGDAWSWLVLREAVLYGARRFTDYLSSTGASRATLNARLLSLTKAGLLSRDSADYVPTPMADDFLGCLLVTMGWGDRWLWQSEPPPWRVVHVSGGHDAYAGLLCGDCNAPLRAHEVHAVRSVDENPHPPLAQSITRQAGVDAMQRGRPCSIARALTIFGDRWTGLIIRECFFGTKRFDDFQQHLGVAPNVLSNRMHRLVDSGFLRRVPYQEWPVRHQYELTEQGRDYYHMPLALMAWARRWLGPGSGDASLIHVPCGRPAEPVFGCLTCGQPMTSGDVTLVAT
jgi:DNA-binding HxlR family transcriptional regulator